MTLLTLMPALLAVAMYAIGQLGSAHQLFVPFMAMGALAAVMAVVVSAPKEEEPQSESSQAPTMAVVSAPRQRQSLTQIDTSLHQPGVRPDGPEIAERPRALIIGSGEVAQTLARNLEKAGGYHVVGFVDDPASSECSLDGLILGGRAATSLIVRDYAIDAVFIASPPSWQQHLAETVIADNPGVSVNVVPSFHDALMRLNCVQSCGDIALVPLTPSVERFNDLVKRVFDLTLSLVGLVITFPLLLFVGILIKATSPGPIIFYQKRVGRDGKTFMLYKFRTMVTNAEAKTGPVLADGKSDSRLTKVGRYLRMFRIDELPQFWNVIRGDMSLVGPRPERPFFVEQFQQRLPAYSRRHHVRPGITGLAQVYGGYHTDAEDKLRFDLIYVSQHTLWLDLAILYRTVKVVCKPHR